MKQRSGMPYDVVAYESDEDAMMLTPEQEGYFHRLLRRAWLNGSIPDDLAKIATLCREKNINKMRKAWAAIRPLWVEHPEEPGRLINSKQESERKFLESYSERQSQRGKKGGEARARNLPKTKKRSVAPAKQTPSDGLASAKQSPSLSHPIPSQPNIKGTSSGSNEPSEAAPNGAESPSGDRARQIAPLARRLFDAYNANCGAMEHAREYSANRRDKCAARIRTHIRDPEQFIGEFESAIRAAAATPFYCGDNEQGWVGNLDYFIRNDGNYLKPLERRNGKRESAAERRRREQNEAVQQVLDELDAHPGRDLQDA